MKPQSSLKKSPTKAPAERVVKDIRRQTRRHFSAEDKIRIVLDGLRGEDSIAELCRKEGIAQSVYYTGSKEFMEAGKRRLAGDTARAATTGEVQDLRREARALKECVADLTLENIDVGYYSLRQFYPASTVDLFATHSKPVMKVEGHLLISRKRASPRFSAHM